jgi:CBS domain-containing protein
MTQQCSQAHVYAVTSESSREAVPVNAASPRAPQLVADVMTRSVVSATADATIKDLAAAMATNRISTIPVLDDDRHVVGVVTASDLLARISGERGRPPRGHRLGAIHEVTVKSHALTADHLMTSPAVTTTEFVPIEAAAAAAALGKVRCLPVVDEDGALVGIATKSDLVKVFLRDDEAVRQDIVERVLGEGMLLETGTVDVDVHDGVVELSGELERKMLKLQLLERVWHVAGVVAVENRLTYRIDDTVPPKIYPRGTY